MGEYDDYDDTKPKLRLVSGTDFEKEKLGIPARYRGVRFLRILDGQHPQENTRLVEAGFSEMWAEMNKREPILERMICAGDDGPRREFVPSNQREWEVAHLVASTLIQWLPTSMGCSFLGEAFEKGGGEFKYRLPDWDRFSC